MRNYFPKRPSGAPLHTLSKLYDVSVGFVPPPPYFDAEYCLFCGRRRVAVARYRMICLVHLIAKEKYRGVFEIQRSGDKTSSGEIGLDIRTHASPKVGQDQVSGGVSVLCTLTSEDIGRVRGFEFFCD